MSDNHINPFPPHRTLHANSIPLPLYKAIVEAVGDEEYPGRIQIRPVPQFDGVDRDLLPWARPLVGSGMNKEEFSFTPPPRKSMVWCVFMDRFWKKPYWLPGQFIHGFFDYDGKVKKGLDGVSELQDTEYPNVRFHLLKGGTILFHNTTTDENGILHASGSYSIFDSDGNIYTYSVGEVHTYNDNGYTRLAEDGTVEINGNTDNAVRYSEVLSAFSELTTDFNNFVSAYNTHTHPDPSSGSTGTTSAPGSPSAADISGSQVEEVLLP